MVLRALSQSLERIFGVCLLLLKNCLSNRLIGVIVRIKRGNRIRLPVTNSVSRKTPVLEFPS